MTIRELKRQVQLAKRVAVPVIMKDDVMYLFVDKKDLLLHGLSGEPDGPVPWRVVSEPDDENLVLDVA